MWRRAWALGIMLVMCLTGVAHGQIGNPFVRLDYGVTPDCPLYCDPVTLWIDGELSSSAWKVPVLTSSTRTGNQIDVVFDVEFDPGNTLPVVVPFAIQVPQGQLPTGAYEVKYTFWIINPIATMPSIPVIFYDTFLVAPPGDQNCDGALDVRDVLHMIQQVFKGGPPPNPEKRSDVTCNGKTDIFDVLALIYHVFGNGQICDYCQSASYMLPVEITFRKPDSLRLDLFVLEDASVTGDTLTIRLSHSGGCMDHKFAVYMSPPSFRDSIPRIADLYPVHDDPGDPCDAWVTETLRFDLRTVAWLYFLKYHHFDDICLDVSAYDQTSYKRVVYHPQ